MINFPTIVTREGKGSPLLNSELDSNFTNTRSYAIALSSMLSTSLNDDGTLKSNTVGSDAIQNASVNLDNLNPKLLYSVIPVDTDTGIANKYKITAYGGLVGSNLINSGSMYDVNGNFVVSGLDLNLGYYWTKAANDSSLEVSSVSTITASGSFVATVESVTLTGTPGMPVTASVVKSAPISEYVDGQIFFIYTANANTGASTLEVNGLSATPIEWNGVALTANMIVGQSVFAVVYKSSTFILMTGSGNSSTSTSTSDYTLTGDVRFESGSIAIGSEQINHGLGDVPSEVKLVLQKTQDDSQNADIAIGTVFDASNFQYVITVSDTDLTADTITLDTSSLTTGQVVSVVGITGAAGYYYISVISSTTAYLYDTYANAITAGATGRFDVTVNDETGTLDPGNRPAFLVSSDSIFVYITCNGTPTLNGVPITTASWVMQMTAILKKDISQISLPALSYMASTPHGCFCYKNNLITIIRPGTSGASKVYSTDMTNGSITVMPNSSNIIMQDCNIAPFLRSDGKMYAIFTSTGGICEIPCEPPDANVVPDFVLYSDDGTYTLTGLTASTVYGWVAGGNDSAYSLDGGLTFITGASFTTGLAQTSIILQGNAKSTVTAKVIDSGADSWSPAQIKPYASARAYKPVWIDETAGTINFVYAVSSSYENGTVKDIRMKKLSNISSDVKFGSATGLDLTNTTIVGYSAGSGFWYFHPVGNTSKLYMVQYNPWKKRIYVITQQAAMVHIFNLTTDSNDIQAWWVSGDYTKLSYSKSIAIAGIGAEWGYHERSKISIEIDPDTGNEKSIAFTRSGQSANYSGSVTRVPWIEA